MARGGLGAAGCRDWSVRQAGAAQWIAVSFPNDQRTGRRGRIVAAVAAVAVPVVLLRVLVWLGGDVLVLLVERRVALDGWSSVCAA
jgi:hypothetical protein